MKKNILLILLAMGGASALFLTGCSKDDTAPPTVSVTGSSSEVVSLGHSWSDDGATANDEEDGVLTATSDASATNPNINTVGTYTITYSATDAAGNVGTAIRTVRVKNDAEEYAKSFLVTDITPDTTITYAQTITVDATVNNKVHFSEFGYYVNNTLIYALRDSVSGNLSIPLQSSGHDIGTGPGACDVVEHFFRTTQFQKLTSSYVFTYVDSVAEAGCQFSTTGTAEYVF